MKFIRNLGKTGFFRIGYLSSDQLFEKQKGQTQSHENILADLYKKSQTSKPQEKLYLFKEWGI